MTISSRNYCQYPTPPRIDNYVVKLPSNLYDSFGQYPATIHEMGNSYDSTECRHQCAGNPLCAAYSYFDSPMEFGEGYGTYNVSGCVMTTLHEGFSKTRGEAPVEVFLKKAEEEATYIKTHWKELLFNTYTQEHREALATGRRRIRETIPCYETPDCRWCCAFESQGITEDNERCITRCPNNEGFRSSTISPTIDGTVWNFQEDYILNSMDTTHKNGFLDAYGEAHRLEYKLLCNAMGAVMGDKCEEKPWNNFHNTWNGKKYLN